MANPLCKSPGIPGKMKKSILIGILLTATILCIAVIMIQPGGSIAKTEIGHIVSMFVNLNTVDVKIEEINENDIEIFWKDEFNGKIAIYKDGKLINKIPMRYGGNTFIVYYKGKILKEYLQFKTNWWHYHKYQFKINKENKIPKCRINIIGPDVGSPA